MSANWVDWVLAVVWVIYICLIAMNRWGTRNQEENTPNFKELFSKHPNAADLLSLPNFPEDAKSNSTPFTQL